MKNFLNPKEFFEFLMNSDQIVVEYLENLPKNSLAVLKSNPGRKNCNKNPGLIQWSDACWNLHMWLNLRLDYIFFYLFYSWILTQANSSHKLDYILAISEIILLKLLSLVFRGDTYFISIFFFRVTIRYSV